MNSEVEPIHQPADQQRLDDCFCNGSGCCDQWCIVCASPPTRARKVATEDFVVPSLPSLNDKKKTTSRRQDEKLGWISAERIVTKDLFERSRQERIERIVASDFVFDGMVVRSARAARAAARQREKFSVATTAKEADAGQRRPKLVKKKTKKRVLGQANEGTTSQSTSSDVDHDETLSTGTQSKKACAIEPEQESSNRDVNAAEDHLSRPPRPKNKLNNQMTFPECLMDMLDKAERYPRWGEIMSWRDDGASFQIDSPKLYEQEIAPHYFHGTTFKNLKNQLVQYNFEHLADITTTTAYRHDKFFQYNLVQCKEIKRCNASAAHERKQQSVETKPKSAKTTRTKDKKRTKSAVWLEQMLQDGLSSSSTSQRPSRKAKQVARTSLSLSIKVESSGLRHFFTDSETSESESESDNESHHDVGESPAALVCSSDINTQPMEVTTSSPPGFEHQSNTNAPLAGRTDNKVAPMEVKSHSGPQKQGNDASAGYLRKRKNHAAFAWTRVSADQPMIEEEKKSEDEDSPPRNKRLRTTTSLQWEEAPLPTTKSLFTAAAQSPTNEASLTKMAGRVADTHSGPVPYEYLEDPNEFYVEEEAHFYHNPPLPSVVTKGVLSKDLRKIPPPPPLPEPPSTGHCQWSYDEVNRVLLAKFDSPRMDPTDETYFLQMLERDDVTVVSEGLLNEEKLDPDLWDRGYWSSTMGNDFYHKFRRFDTFKSGDNQDEETCVEVEKQYSMRMTDYMRYLSCRQQYLEKNNARESEKGAMFQFTDHNDKEHCIHVGTSCLSMIDFDLSRHFPAVHENFKESFGYGKVLPGGDFCMMNSVPSSARPSMGPNLHLTPPAAYTKFHQDGHETVDSGHLVISGYNEVVMLRRLTERHRNHAMWLLTGDQNMDTTANTPDTLDGFYSEPHLNEQGQKASWPTTDRIQSCRDMGYCPSVLILQPSQFIHINKGRLHTFRKMATSKLPEKDCHSTMRAKIVDEQKLKGEILYMGITWDWMFRGMTTAGINREVCSVIESTILNRKNGKGSPIIPETSLLQMAKHFAPVDRETFPENEYGCLLQGRKESTNADESRNRRPRTMRSKVKVCRGFLPGLRYVVSHQMEATMESGKHSRHSQERARLLQRVEAAVERADFAESQYLDDCKFTEQRFALAAMRFD